MPHELNGRSGIREKKTTTLRLGVAQWCKFSEHSPFAIGEDSVDLPAHKRVSEFAKWTKRKAIPDPIQHRCSARRRFEGVRVLPNCVGAAELFIHESAGRIPD